MPRGVGVRVVNEDGDVRGDDGSVTVSVPRDDSGPRRVSAHTRDGKVTVRTAN
ncbi:hypothetical protein [Streptomyces sp. NPDC004658]|uniref:hypothetical protein n=1 Tax=Streptomyces sp. NPDC004658 TaxID=3154672 RepID=UPI0033B857F9